ncbi:hypothetical protein MCOR27_006644 [Pyricularia oryzae]|uniref:DUF7053 domain-containing protein n=5 Tax=Pyricularia TaxID=48558 RepID=G5EHA6_PYRO7|nr:uncharacterized protein MGG_02889 [Pyricularia oryzae 70-15]ELQ40223.1 hypothetical protein OOU_Y34scaffold00458g51 [Pyricularia oryzae Y34]KAH8838437.1 hypothetical protein MCOR01_009876 [Pyricularia oryzae]KAI6299909.1 hypothetical protein MCOR33_004297 [Pyricularia grisea]EAQ71245.1 hypothetical protein MGCH7_ch7g652 [Pyricularia oryzae 70-15]EHA46095.1 hypothetical protein MGG_02889 [Pyricularia oryzae 70-15]
MGLFDTSDSWEVWTEISGVQRDQALELVHDHDYFLHTADPQFVSYESETITAKDGLTRLPADMHSDATGPTQCYAVTDNIPGPIAKLIPGKSTAVNHYQLTNTTQGMFINFKGAMGLVSDRKMTIRDAGNGNIRIVQEVGLKCKKMMLGVLRGQYEQHWRRIHEEYAKKMGGDIVGHSDGLTSA